MRAGDEADVAAARGHHEFHALRLLVFHLRQDWRGQEGIIGGRDTQRRRGDLADEAQRA